MTLINVLFLAFTSLKLTAQTSARPYADIRSSEIKIPFAVGISKAKNFDSFVAFFLILIDKLSSGEE